jgi:hypothetical protein
MSRLRLLLVATLLFPCSAAAVSNSRPTTFDAVRRIDVNLVNMWVTNYGSFAWDITTGNAGLIYPHGPTAQVEQWAVYASGLWLAGKRGGQTLVTVAEYSEEFGPGPMVGSLPDNPGAPDARVYKVVRWTGNPADSAHVDHTAAELASDPDLDPLAHHSWSEYMAGAAPHGAPWKYYSLPDGQNGTVLVPGPDVLGDQMLWAVYNDADPNLHQNQAGHTAPIGVEVQQTTFAYASPPELASTVFLKFRIMNKSGQPLDQAFVSLWSDPDIGQFTDDLVGCDVPASLGYAYNGTPVDFLYGPNPPAVGYDLFRGPHGLGMYAFNKYVNGTDPTSPTQSYNYQMGLNPDGSALIDPTTTLPTRYFVTGDPVTGTGWLDTHPGDRRMLLSSGPFTFAAGETTEVLGGIVIGQGADYLASITAMRARDLYAQQFVDAGFDHPVPALATAVSADASDGRVHLVWLASGSVRIERREEATVWQEIGMASADGTGRITWTDSDVRRGTRYGYRVVVGDVVAGEVWVAVPNGLGLAVSRTSNPSLASFQASLELPEDAPATLEVFDVSGRHVLTREISGRGQHVIDLSDGLRSGLYFLRLHQGAARAETRTVFLK